MANSRKLALQDMAGAPLSEAESHNFQTEGAKLPYLIELLASAEDDHDDEGEAFDDAIGFYLTFL